jgi:hypothetical protein
MWPDIFLYEICMLCEIFYVSIRFIAILTRLSVDYTSHYQWSLGFLASTSNAKFNQNVTVGPRAEWHAVKLFRVPSRNERLDLRNQMDIPTAANLRNILFTDFHVQHCK